MSVAYHKINRQNYYKISIREEMLRRAFLNDFGLSQMVTNLMNSLYNSANVDEFELTCSLIAEYADKGGFFKKNVPAVTDEASAKTLLKAIRSMAGNLEFYSTHYNAAKLPTFAEQDELVLLVSPEVKAEMDVEAFAAAFNIPFTDVPARIISIPKEKFRIGGAQAILTTKDFFIIADSLMENREIQNPASLDKNYFFHIHQILSVSLFVPAILFWTGAGDVIETDETVVTGISAITAKYSQDGSTVTDPAALTRGELYIMEATATTDPADGLNDGVKWYVTGQASTGTFISQTGNLQIAGTETAEEITVTAVSSWINPDGILEEGESVSRVFDLTGETLALWPKAETVPAP